MVTIKLKNSVFPGLLALCFLLTGCDTASESSSNHQYLVMPDAVFIPGPSPGGVAPTAQKPTVSTTSSTTYIVNQPVVWTVNFTTVIDIEVTEIIIVIEEVEGYYVYPLTDEELAQGWVDIETVVYDEEPSTQVCNRDWRGNGTCYEKADEGVTNMDFSAVNSIGCNAECVSTGGAGITWTPPVEQAVLIPVVVDEDDSYSGDTTCTDWTTYGNCNMRTCSDGNNTWYDIGEGVYYCAAAGDCTVAAQNVANYCYNY